MRDRLIIALDTPDPKEALSLGRRLKGRVGWVKVGMTLFYAEGPGIVGRLRDLGFQVFADLKLHDIPHQVAGAARDLAKLGAGMISVHASGGRLMVAAAVRSVRDAVAELGVAEPAVLGVTVLTSLDAEALSDVGVFRKPAGQVKHLGLLAFESGACGVVCSVEEAAEMRRVLGSDALVVTPGVRPKWAERGDQARVATPAEALRAGASHLVIGRPVTAADDPVAAVDRILEEIDAERGV